MQLVTAPHSTASGGVVKTWVRTLVLWGNFYGCSKEHRLLTISIITIEQVWSSLVASVFHWTLPLYFSCTLPLAFLFTSPLACLILLADVMKAAGASIIFAVDVGAQEDRNYTNYGDHLSGFWLLWKKWNPWAEPVSSGNVMLCSTSSCTQFLVLEKGR